MAEKPRALNSPQDEKMDSEDESMKSDSESDEEMEKTENAVDVNEENADEEEDEEEDVDDKEENIDKQDEDIKAEDVDQELISLLRKLETKDEETRLKVVIELLTWLKNRQSKFEQDEDNKDDLCPEVQYCFCKLFSNCGPSRNTYFVTLVEILKNVKNITSTQIIGILQEMSKTEVDDDVPSKFFSGVSALIRCRILNDDSVFISTVVKFVCKTIKTNPALECYCIEIMQELLENVDQDTFEALIFPLVEADLTSGWKSATPFSFWLVLKSRSLFSNVVNKEFLKQHWIKGTLLSEVMLGKLSYIMRESVSVHPAVHPVSTEIANAIIEKPAFENFWTLVVDGAFVNKQEKLTSLAYEMFKILLPKIDTQENLEIILSPSLLTSLLTNSLSKNSPLHSKASSLIEQLLKFSKQVDESYQQYLIVERLTNQKNTGINNELIYGFSKKFLASLKPKAVKLYFENSIEVFKGNKNQSLEFRKFVGTKLPLMVHHPSLKLECSWLLDLIKMLYFNTRFVLNNDAVSQLVKDEDVIKMIDRLIDPCRMLFSACLQRLGTFAREGFQKYSDCLHEIVKYAKSLFDSPDCTFRYPSFKDEHVEMLDKVISVSSEMKKKKYAKGIQSEAFLACIHLMALKPSVEKCELLPALQDLEAHYHKQLSESITISDGKTKTDRLKWIEIVLFMFLDHMHSHRSLLRETVTDLLDSVKQFVPQLVLEDLCNVITTGDDIDESETNEGDKVKGDDEVKDDDDEVKDEDKVKDDDEDGDKKASANDKKVEEEIDSRLWNAYKQWNAAANTSIPMGKFKNRCLRICERFLKNDIIPQSFCTIVAPLLRLVLNDDIKAPKVKKQITELLTFKGFERVVMNDEPFNVQETWSELINLAGRALKSNKDLGIEEAMATMANEIIRNSGKESTIQQELFNVYRDCLRDCFELKDFDNMYVFFALRNTNPEFSNFVIDDLIELAEMDHEELEFQPLALLERIVRYDEVTKDWTNDECMFLANKVASLVAKKDVSEGGSLALLVSKFLMACDENEMKDDATTVHLLDNVTRAIKSYTSRTSSSAKTILHVILRKIKGEREGGKLSSSESNSFRGRGGFRGRGRSSSRGFRGSRGREGRVSTFSRGRSSFGSRPSRGRGVALGNRDTEGGFRGRGRPFNQSSPRGFGGGRGDSGTSFRGSRGSSFGSGRGTSFGGDRGTSFRGRGGDHGSPRGSWGSGGRDRDTPRGGFRGNRGVGRGRQFGTRDGFSNGAVKQGVRQFSGLGGLSDSSPAPFHRGRGDGSFRGRGRGGFKSPNAPIQRGGRSFNGRGRGDSGKKGGDRGKNGEKKGGNFERKRKLDGIPKSDQPRKHIKFDNNA